MGIAVGGLSGIDTESLITQLMDLEKIPLQKLEDRKDEYNAKKDAFNTFNTKLLSLNTAAEKLLDSTTFEAKNTTVSDSSVLSATASSSASLGTYNFTNITLGSQSYTTSQNDIANNTLDLTKDLDTLQGAGDFVNALGGSGTGSFKVQVKDASDNVVNETTINYDTTTDTLNDIISRINNAGIDVTAFYDEDASVNGKFSMTTNTAGAYYIDIDTTNDTQGLANTLDIYNPVNFADANTAGAFITTGTDTTAKLNGVDITPDGNKYEVNGVSITFLSNGSSSVTVDTDTDSVYNSISDFVTKYNSVQDYIKSQTSYADGAAGGDLAGNFLVTDVGYNLNSKVFTSYSDLSSNGQYSMLAQIGITLGEYGTTDANHLTIDSSTLKEAIAANPKQVQILFGYNTSTPTETSVVPNAGIAYNVSEYMDPLTKFKGLISNEKESLDSLISNLNDTIDSYNDRIDAQEEMYRKQFSSMETMLQQLNSQGDYFSSQLAGLSS